jgi:hypothetical protein
MLAHPLQAGPGPIVGECFPNHRAPAYHVPMCGRYARFTPQDLYSRLFRASDMGKLSPRYNIAPSQALLVARNSEWGDYRELITVDWGLLPPWAKGPKDGPRPINVRAETAHERPMFRKALARRRCLLTSAIAGARHALGYHIGYHRERMKGPRRPRPTGPATASLGGVGPPVSSSSRGRKPPGPSSCAIGLRRTPSGPPAPIQPRSPLGASGSTQSEDCSPTLRRPPLPPTQSSSLLTASSHDRRWDGPRTVYAAVAFLGYAVDLRTWSQILSTSPLKVS